jgi:probable F420-dependent oxidoreductase
MRDGPTDVETGLVLPKEIKLRPQALAIAAHGAEELRLHSLWVTEHIAVPVEIRSRYPYSTDGNPPFRHDSGPPEALVTLGFLAAATRQIRLGTAVIPLFCFDPLSLAKLAATADLLADGRIELGLGAGWLSEEAALLGHPADHRAGRLDEAIQILRKAWGTESFEHRGRFYSYPRLGVHPHPRQGADLPIWIGGSGSAALRTTAKHAVGNIVFNATVDSVTDLTRRLQRNERSIRVAATLDLSERLELGPRARRLANAGADLILLTHTTGDPDRLLTDVSGFLAEVGET